MTTTMNAEKSLTQTLCKVRAGADQRRAAAEQAYRALVRKCATGKEEVSPEHILTKLEDWDRTAEDFQADVEALAHRLDLKVLADQLPGWQSQLTAVNAKITEASRECEVAITAARARLLEVAVPLEAQAAQLTAAVKRAEAAGAELVEKNAYPHLAAAQAAAHERVRVANVSLKRITDGIAEARATVIPRLVSDLEFERGTVTNLWHDLPQYTEWQKEKKNRIAKAEKRLAEMKAQVGEDEATALPAAQTELAEAEAELAEVLAEFANP